MGVTPQATKWPPEWCVLAILGTVVLSISTFLYAIVRAISLSTTCEKLAVAVDTAPGNDFVNKLSQLPIVVVVVVALMVAEGVVVVVFFAAARSGRSHASFPPRSLGAGSLCNSGRRGCEGH